MIRRLLPIVSCIALAPAALAGQRSGIGGFGGRGPGAPSREPGLVVPKLVNPVNLLIEHRQELSLSDSQFVRVIAIKRSLDSTNAPRMRTLDSVGFLFRGGAPLFQQPSAARRDSLAEGRAVIREVQAAVRENIDAARDRAYALLNEQQLITAQSLAARAEKAIDDETKRKTTKP